MIAQLDIPSVTDTSVAGDGFALDVDIPDGIEIAAGVEIALWQSCNTTSSTVTVTLIGFEY